MMINEQLKREFERDIEDYGKNLILVEPQENFNFPFFLYIPPVDPSDMMTSIIMDCLNDYEEELLEGMRVNSEAVKELYKEFYDKKTVIITSENGENTNNSNDKEEEE